ncbi:MAG: 4Fe-4S dicluster domain-containing protein [Ruminococcus sp.]|nr:4Fe-4S dicluster domain-containing protein [Ruminococcus sp.]
MTAKDYLEYIVEQIHSTVVATVDEDGLPVTCVIDMMYADENGLFFLTAKGKSFYKRLKDKGFIALSGKKGEDTMSCVAVSVRGRVKEIGSDMLSVLFEKNPYMYEIYLTSDSRKALTVFQLYEGSGEWFDLSKKPIERDSFSFGGAKSKTSGYFVTDNCIGCGACLNDCPQSCIDLTDSRAVIRQQNCLHCGNCAAICPVGAVIVR